MIYSSEYIAQQRLCEKPHAEPWMIQEHPQGGFYLTLFGLPERYYERN